MLGAIAFGTWCGFPVFDDAYLLLFLREQGHGSIAGANSHRPLCGLLLQGFVDTFGPSRLPYVALNFAFWVLLAWQTWRLSRRLFVDDAGTAVLSALFVLAPILVKTHYTTITTLFPANLPVSICFAVLLFTLRNDAERRPVPLVLAGGLVLAAATLSEYGVAAAAASIVFLLALQKRRAALIILFGAIIGYLVFQSIGDFRLRPTKVTTTQFEMLTQRPLQTVLHFFVSLWQCFIGAYGTAVGKIQLEAGSRSTIFSAFAGVVAMGMILKWFPQSNPDASQNDSRRSTIAVLFAVASGLIPVVLANQSPASGDSYETRFFIPILPFATIAIVRGSLRLAMPRFRPWIAAILTFVAVYAVCIGAFEKRREQKTMKDLGRLLEPIVRGTDEITIAVVPDYEKLGGPDITPKVAWNWPGTLVQRLWVMTTNEALLLFGPRTECRNASWIDIAPGFLSVGRRGPVSHLMFVPSFWTSQKEFSHKSLEPYCIEPVKLESTQDQNQAQK